MQDHLQTTIWNQFGASIDMLENALAACPIELWDADSRFWYIGYHTLFFLDYYLTPVPEEAFLPPAPFTCSEFEDGQLPARTYTREELLNYLAFCRNKCRLLLAGLTTSQSLECFVPNRKGFTVIEILLYNMRHVQHHAAQLNLLLRQHGCEPPGWISRTKKVGEL